MISDLKMISEVARIDKDHPNSIPSNLIEELGVTVNKNTIDRLKEMGIKVTEPIKYKETWKEIDILSPHETLYFVLRAQNNKDNGEAATIITKAFDKKIQAMALEKCRANSLDNEEDIQEFVSAGYEGLSKAIKHFDINKSYLFQALVPICAEHEMQKEIVKEGYLTSVRMTADSINISRRVMAYAEYNGIKANRWSERDIQGCSEKTGLSVLQIRRGIRNSQFFKKNETAIDTVENPDYIYSSRRDQGTARYRQSSVRKSSGVEEVYEAKESEERVITALMSVPKEDLEFTYDWIGLTGKKMNPSQLGRKYGKTRYKANQKIEELKKELLENIVL